MAAEMPTATATRTAIFPSCLPAAGAARLRPAVMSNSAPNPPPTCISPCWIGWACRDWSGSGIQRDGLRGFDLMETTGEFPREDYLHPPPLKSGVLKRIYQNQTKAERDEEISAARACHRPENDGQE